MEGAQLALATALDARRIAEVHVRARTSAYEGLIPADQLAAERVDDREGRWTARLSNPDGRCWMLSEGDDLFGFAYTAPTQDDDLGPESAELFGLYLLPEKIGRGFGREVTERAVTDLEERGFAEVVLWVAAENVRAVHFYERAGFEPDGRTPEVPFGETGLTNRRMRRKLERAAASSDTDALTVRVDGFYRLLSEKGVPHLIRFFPSGEVVGVSVDADPEEFADMIAGWLHPGHVGVWVGRVSLEDGPGAPPKGGVCRIAGSTLEFSLNSDEGVVSYSGTTSGERLMLTAHSRINDERSLDHYQFVRVE